MESYKAHRFSTLGFPPWLDVSLAQREAPQEAKRGRESAADTSGTESSTSRCRRPATIRCPRGPSRQKEGSESRLSRKYATSAISAQALLHQQIRSLKEDIFRIVNMLISYI